MKCNHCDKEAQWVENKKVYGKNYGKSYMIWWCEDCDAYVGCHKNTVIPLGKYLVKAPVRKARQKVHAVIDPLWKSGKYTRKKVYQMLNDAFGYQIHIGNTKSIKECEDIIKTTKLIFKEINH